MPTDDTNICFNISGPTQIIMVSSGCPLTLMKLRLLERLPRFLLVVYEGLRHPLRHHVTQVDLEPVASVILWLSLLSTQDYRWATTMPVYGISGRADGSGFKAVL